MLSAVALGCSDAKPRPKPSDPAAPAVVQAPKLVLPSDTMKRPDPVPVATVTQEDARRRTAIDFAVLGAAIIFGDTRMVGSTYASDAQLTTPDSVLHGAAQIASSLIALGREKSLKDFARRSQFTSVKDSSVTDSGLYSIITKRTGADSILESGHYATTWRVRPAPENWVILKDRLYRQSSRRRH